MFLASPIIRLQEALRGQSSSQLLVFEEAVIAFDVENEVVEKFDAEEFAGGSKAFGDINVFFARDERARGVVVGDNDRGCPVGNSIGEDLARVYLRLIGKSDRNDTRGHYLISAIDGNAQEVLLFAVGIIHDERKDVRRKRYFKTFGSDAAAGKFKCGCDKCRLCRAHARNCLQDFHVNIAVIRFDGFENLLGH